MSLRTSLVCLFFLLAFLQSPLLQGQNKYTLSGYIKDSQSGETLIGANVYNKDNLNHGTTTNLYGFFSMTLPEGEYTIVVSYLGYQDKVQTVQLNENVRLNVELASTAVMKKEVVVTGKRRDANVESTDMGTVELPIEQVKTLPVLFGEVDVMKTIQLLPGVQSAGEGNSGFYVRGGGPDQNLILLDEAVVYNSGHLFGFFSIFNADALKKTTLIKGGMPAYYGGRLSSVLDIQMKEGNNQEFHATGGIGTISSRLTVEGPLQKNKGSFILSGRRAYVDLLLKPALKGTDFEGNNYFFYDFNAKANYGFSDKDRLYASGYFGRDVFSFKDPTGFFNISIPWGNATTTLRWNHLFNEQLFMNATAIYNDYNFEVDLKVDDVRFILYSGIRDANLKLDFDYFPSLKHNIKYGLNYTYHTFTPSTATAESDEFELQTDEVAQKYAHESGLYFQDEWEISNRFKVNAGLRYSFFQHIGPYKQLIFDEEGIDVIDSIIFDRAEPVKTYHGLEPRLSVRMKTGYASSLKASFTKNNQYLHLVSNSGTTLPTDIWVPSSILVNPQIGYQYAFGYFQNLRENAYEASIEVYYKDLQNQIEYREGYAPQIDREVELDFVFGKGWSYGAEFFLKKSTGKFTGWIGYTLSWTNRLFKDLNQGRQFVAKYDRRHDIAIVLSYKPSPRWSLATTFIYGTGNAITLPTSWYLTEVTLQYDYERLNGQRLPPYHRMDVSAILHGKPEKKFKSDWAFAIYNVYNRPNPYFIYIEPEGKPSEPGFRVKANQVSLFPIVPSVTWNFKF